MKRVPTRYTLFSTYLNSGPVPEGYGWTASYWSAQAKRPKYNKHALPAAIREWFAGTIEEELTAMPSSLSGTCYLGLDVSGSMGCPVQNESLVRCIDVVGLIYTARRFRCASLLLSFRSLSGIMALVSDRRKP